MNAQPEALRLADELEDEHYPWPRFPAAAELRRLSAENESLRQIVQDFPPVEAELREVSDRAHRLEAQRDALLEALKQIEPILARMYGQQAAELPPMQIVRAAIKAVEGEKT